MDVLSYDIFIFDDERYYYFEQNGNTKGIYSNLLTLKVLSSVKFAAIYIICTAFNKHIIKMMYSLR